MDPLHLALPKTPPPTATPPPPSAPVDTVNIGSSTDLKLLNAVFERLRPPQKKTFLDTMQKGDPHLKARWDAYIAGQQQTFANAHPPVPKLTPEQEQAIRRALSARPDVVPKLNCYAPVDCDGSGHAYGDWETDIDTSMHYHNKPLNADQVLYHVATMDHPELYDCLAINFIDGHMVPTVFGDEGPAYGEGSHLTIQLLGLYSSPIDGGAGSSHDMYLLHGLGAEFAKRGLPATPENLHAFCHEKGLPGF